MSETNDAMAAKLARLVRAQFGEKAAKIGYSRDEYDIVLWTVRDAAGRLLWDARPNDTDIPEWDGLGEAVDLFAKVIESNPRRGQRLAYVLVTDSPAEETAIPPEGPRR